MNNDILIKYLENTINNISQVFEFKIYDVLKMDYEEMDDNKINGIANISSGIPDPIFELGQTPVTMQVEFIYPVERQEAVKQTLTDLATNTAGIVLENSTLDPALGGYTGVQITYPLQGNYTNGMLGQIIKSRIICYFDINERAVLANQVKLSIQNGTQDVAKSLSGTYYVKNINYSAVTLPDDYTADQTYYTLTDGEYVVADVTSESIGTYYVQNVTYTAVELPNDYTANTIYYILDGEEYKEYNSTLSGWYFTNGNRVLLPTAYKANTLYEEAVWQFIPCYKHVITRHRLSTTNKFENNKEMQTINDGQSIDISIAVPSIKGSVVNSIKDDMLKGENTQKLFSFKETDESGDKFYWDMLASGDFTYEIIPGDTVLLKILFVYGRK